MDSILNWVGGKSNSAKKIVELMPEHFCYVEAFFGAGWCFFEKPRAKVEVINDVNGELINFWRVIQRQPEEFKTREKYEMYSRELYEEYYRDFDEGKHIKLSNLERAFRFFCMIKCAFASKWKGGWGYGPSRNQGDAFFNEFKIIDEIAARLKHVQIDNKDFEQLIKDYDRVDTLTFCCLPNTKIRMKNEEIKNIQDINIDDITFGGGKVVNIMKKDYKGLIYEFEYIGAYDNLHVTSDHPLAIIRQNEVYEIKNSHVSKFKNQQSLNNSNVIFKSAKDIDIGDFLLVPCHPESLYEIKTIKIGNVDIECDFQFGWICGLWIAEGNFVRYYNENIPHKYDLLNIKTGKQKSLVSYSDNNINSQNIDEIIKKNEYDSLYSIQYTFGEKDNGRGIFEALNVWYKNNFNKMANPLRNTLHNSYTLVYNIPDMAMYLHNKFGEHSHHKSICNEILNYPLSFQKGLLRGWLDGDGGVCGDLRNRIKITGTTVSKQLALDMYQIALRLGLKPLLKLRHGTTWDVYFSSLDDVKFIYPDNVIDINQKSRTKRKIILKDDKKFIITPITNIKTYKYDGTVHNLTTENKIYVANYIVSHNCDPPYIKTDVDGQYFKSMGANSIIGFGLHDHQRLYKTLIGLKGKFILTIDDAPFIRERYCVGNQGSNGFWWIDNTVFYSSADKDNRRHVTELIITNYDTTEVIKQNIAKKVNGTITGTKSLMDY